MKRQRGIRLIALDVDGTLVNDEHQIMPMTKKIVRELAERGLMIVLCTGRGPRNTLPILEELGIDGYMLNHNGAVTCHSRPYRVLEQSTFPVRLVSQVIDYCRQTGVHFDLCTADELYCESLADDVREMYEHFLIRPVKMENAMSLAEPIVKLTLFGEPSQMDRVQADFTKQFVDRHEWTDQLVMIRSDIRFIDFMLPNVSKGIALHQLCVKYEIDPSQVIAIGNYYNDQQMIEFAGVGIAMANSPDDLKSLADDVTASNNEEGVYHALRKYIFETTSL
jgi:Cof subfamily protein (haloacid dehalogenase superfamily)